MTASTNSTIPCGFPPWRVATIHNQWRPAVIIKFPRERSGRILSRPPRPSKKRKPAIGRRGRNPESDAELRAIEIVGVLQQRHVRDGWLFDTKRAVQFVKNVRELDPNDGDAMLPIIEWVSDHGQSLDWIFRGDPSVMICAAAAVTPTRPRLTLVVSDNDPA